MVSTYDKPFLTVDAQLDRLAERGLAFDDRDEARRELQSIGYFRLSGYWYPFRKSAPSKDEQRPSEFVEGANLAELLETYRFDAQLRKELLHAISLIEVALRFSVGHTLGQRGPFAHYDATFLDPGWSKKRTQKCSSPNCDDSCSWESGEHTAWTSKQNRNEQISNEAFIAHFQSSYGKPLPVWTATEVMTFGDLIRLYNGMTQRDRQKIALDYDLHLANGDGDAGTLSNWLEHLRQSRNYCAHHARVWNRNHTAPLSAPPAPSVLAHLRGDAKDADGALMIHKPARRVYGTIAVVAYLLLRIDGTNAVRDNLIGMIKDFCSLDPKRYSDMGFPQDWEAHQIWQESYARDPDLAAQSRLLRNVELLATTDAASYLSLKPTHAKQKSLLTFYRRNGAALSVPGTESHRYPSFQFDRDNGDLHSSAITANRHLLQGKGGSEEERWAALEWWVTPNQSLPDSSRPLDMLLDNKLSDDLLEASLPVRDEQGESSIAQES